MSDELHICTSRTELYADSEPACLQIEDERLALMLDEMENAYRYELWQCLQKLTEMDGKLTPIYNSLETITQAEVHAMWNDEVFKLNVSKLNVNKLS